MIKAIQEAAQRSPAATHVDTKFEQLESNASRPKLQFEAITVLDYAPSYEHAVDMLKRRMEAFGKHEPNSQASRN